MNIDQNLFEHVAAQKDKKVPYAIVRGTVTPIGTPLQSIMSPSVTGVLQVIKVKYVHMTLNLFEALLKINGNFFFSEHRITRGFAGFWTEQRKLFHVSSSEVPFQITNKDVGIEILDPLSADILGL